MHWNGPKDVSARKEGGWEKTEKTTFFLKCDLVIREAETASLVTC